MAKKKKKPEPKSKYVYLIYHEYRSGGEIKSGQEDDAWPSHEDLFIDFQPEALITEEPSWSERIEVDFDPIKQIGQNVYVVVVRYENGSTFGHSEGNWYVVGAYLDEQAALALEKSIVNGKYKGYKAWEGYFERFQHVEIHSFVLHKKAGGASPDTKMIHHA